jgi:hypothetical protein
MTYIGDSPSYPKLSTTELERYKDIARETIKQCPYIRYGQAIVNALRTEGHMVIYPQLFYCRDEQKVEELIKLMEIDNGD